MFQAWNSQTCAKVGSSFVIQSASCAASKNLSSCCKSLARIQRKLEIKPRKPPSATVVNASIGGAFSSTAMCVRPSESRSWFNDFCTWPEQNNSAAASTSRRLFLRRAFMSASGKSSKLQAPSSREIPNPKLQAAQSKARTWRLVLGASLDVGGWCLEFSLRSLRRGQFAPVEKNDARHRKNPAQQQDDLREGQAKFAPGDAASGAQRVNRRKVFREAHHGQHAFESGDQHHVRHRMARSEEHTSEL